MTNQDNRSKAATGFREKAEAIAKERAVRMPEGSAAISSEEIQRVLHELRVHQIELEMQNEELRMAQAQIEAGMARYFDLYDLAPVGYCTVSEKGVILEANLTMATLLGVTRSLLVTQPISRFIVKDDQDIYYLHQKRIFETAEPQECDLRLVKPGSALIWVHLSGIVAQSVEGLPVCRLVLGDITGRKLAEEINEKLESQLIQVQKMESVGRLAGGVAHDFNNMLGIILGYTELALGRVLPNDPLHADLEEICKAAQRSADLTRQLLAFARKQIVAPKMLNLNVTVEGILKMLRRLIGEDICLSWNPGQGLWQIRMDPTQIDQILANLCVNARDAITGIGTVTVETHNIILDEEFCAEQAGFTPGEYVMLKVSDDGCGMDSKTLSLTFEPFFTTKEMGKGTGLGLATVYGIVKQNNGFINVDSEPGRGTAFYIYLPRYLGEPDPQREKAPAEVMVYGHETILLVEDEPGILKMTQTILERQGYTVLATSSPAEAVRLAREHCGRIDLLLTDVVMPEINGCDLARHLLAICPGIRCLFMSGYTANIIAHHGVLEERDHFIQKPFSIKALGGKLREILDA
ncbi:ATP-binding protein [Desulfobotulus sp. H1]|uniref:histidine kinase n=1 Tax=Desulfobotulus pelophilus TaxID=2823377 RepID=A0ABT3N8U2_9BACT|nr:ATP-binding protein [Desulfobotulus pelophilus]MCW7753452.1 ATP-binding protein [Desulfobotulus pelophilus]